MALNAGIVPYGSITPPAEGQVFFGGTVSFDAIYWDDDFDPVSWAVRRGTDASATNTVWGNVDGHNDPYTWDGHLFHSSADVSSWTSGWYYAFVWNSSEDAGEADIRLVRGFYIAGLTNLAPPQDNNLVGTTHTVTVSIGVPVEDPGASGMHYDGATMTWQFNWQIKGLQAGDAMKLALQAVRRIKWTAPSRFS